MYSEFLTGLSQDKSSQDRLKHVSQDYDDAHALSNLSTDTNFKYQRNAYNAINKSWGMGIQVDNGDTVWLTRAGATINANNFSSRNPEILPGQGKAGNIQVSARSILLDNTFPESLGSITLPRNILQSQTKKS